MKADPSRTKLPDLSTAVGAQMTVPVLSGMWAAPAMAGDDGLTELAISGAKKMYPFEAVADWTHRLPTSPTDRWMDHLGRDQFYHRWRGHHLFSDGWQALTDPSLSPVDFVKHLGLDVITVHGIPALSSSGIGFLSEVTGMSVGKLMPWVSHNVFDLSLGVVSCGDSIGRVYLAMTGGMEWGTQTALLTFGGGATEVVQGLCTARPLMCVAGAGDILAGTISMCDYYNQPFFLGVPVADLLKGVGCGAGAGMLVSTVVMALNWKSKTPVQHAKDTARSLAIGSVMGGLAAISSWLSGPASAIWTLGNLAVKLAAQQQLAMESHPLSSPLSLRAGLLRMIEQKGVEGTATWLRRQVEPHSTERYDQFIRLAEERILARHRRRITPP